MLKVINVKKAMEEPTQKKTVERGVIVVMGPCGCGKTSLARFLVQKFEPCSIFIEGDSLHPAENVLKMSKGERENMLYQPDTLKPIMGPWSIPATIISMGPTKKEPKNQW